MSKYTKLVEFDNGKYKCALKSKCKNGDKCKKPCEMYINAVLESLYIFENLYLEQNSNVK